MASKIEWTEETWNPVVGCTIVSPGCTNCYAMKTAGRLQAIGVSHYAGMVEKHKTGFVWTGKVAMAPESVLQTPLRRRKPTVYFVNSMGDLFHDDVDEVMIDAVYAVMARCPQHTFQILTKRAARMKDVLTRLHKLVTSWQDEIDEDDYDLTGDRAARAFELAFPALYAAMTKLERECRTSWPLPNVWQGVSAEDQPRAEERIWALLSTPAAVRFASLEPLLGPIDLTELDIDGDSTCDALNRRTWAGEIEQWRDTSEDWRDDFLEFFNLAVMPDGGFMAPVLDLVIVGGESGPRARPMHPDWARAIRDACAEAQVAFFFKQWGEWAPGENNAGGISRRTERVAEWWNDQWDYHQVTPKESEEMHVDDEPTVWRLGKRQTGRHLDGVIHDAMPEVSRG